MAHFSGHRQPATVPSHFKDLFTNGQLGAAEESNNNDQNEQENRPSNNNNAGPSDPACWVFGYGSLCWHPGFNYTKCITGYIRGYVRRFWQGNVTHRGCEEKVGGINQIVDLETSGPRLLTFCSCVYPTTSGGDQVIILLPPLFVLNSCQFSVIRRHALSIRRALSVVFG